MLLSFKGIFIILATIAIGYYYSKKPWFGERGGDFLSKLTIQLAIPFYMFYNVVSTYDSKEALLDTLKSFPVPFFSIIICLFIGYILTIALKIGPGRKGLFINMTGFSNTVLIGFPIVTSLYGDGVAIYSLVFYMANTALFWTVGTYLIKRDAGEKAKVISLQSLKNTLTPPFVGFFLGVVAVISNIRPHSVMMDVIRNIANTASPLSIIFVGCVMAHADLKSIKFDATTNSVLLCRFLLSPLIMLGMCWFVPIPIIMKKIFILLAGMPMMAQAAIISREYKADCEFASIMVTLSTMVSMITIPITMLIVEQIFA